MGNDNLPSDPKVNPPGCICRYNHKSDPMCPYVEPLTSNEHAKWLRIVADEAHTNGAFVWANTCRLAASEIDRLQKIYVQAVEGRRNFREAYRDGRVLLQEFVKAWEGQPGHQNMDRLCELARSPSPLDEAERAAPETPQPASRTLADEVERLNSELNARDALDGEWQSEIDRLTRERDAAYASQRKAAEVFEKHRKSAPNAPETSPPHDIEASVGCGNCVEAHYVLTAAGIADGDLAEKIDDLVSERDAALEALRRIRDQSAQDYEDPEQEAYASRDIARKALEGVPQSETNARTRKVRCADHGTFEELESYPEIGNCPICQQPMNAVKASDTSGIHTGPDGICDHEGRRDSCTVCQGRS